MSSASAQFNAFGLTPVGTETDSFCDTSIHFFQKKWSTVFKAFYTTIDWFKELNRIPKGWEDSFAAARTNFNLVKLARFPGELLDNGSKLHQATSEFLEDHKSEKFWKMAFAANECVNPVKEGAQFITQTIALSQIKAPWVEALKFAGNISLALGKGRSVLYEHVQVLTSSDATAKQKWLALLNLAKDVSYVAIGVLGVIALFVAAATAVTLSTAILVFSTSTIVFTTAAFYYENWGKVKEEKSI